jgi:omega-amidase
MAAGLWGGSDPDTAGDMNLLLGQIDIVWENIGENLRRVETAIGRHAPMPDTVLILPEMFATGFSMEVSRTCGGGEVEVLESLARWARERRIWILAGATVGGQGRNRNVVVGMDPQGNEVLRFTKLHGFSPASEPAAYTPGEDVLVREFAGIRLAPFICYDLRFPEVFRRAASRGAEWMVVVANWPARRERHWLTLLQARAIENQCWVIGVNRAGSDPQASYTGRSLVVDPMGVIRCDAGEGERWVGFTMDPEETTRWRGQFPAWRDRRVWVEPTD